MTVPVSAEDSASDPVGGVTMFGPDFPFAYDDWVRHPAGIGTVPDAALGTEVAVIGGGLSGMLVAHELVRAGLKPIVYEADRIGGRMRSEQFPGAPRGVVAEMGSMRFPPSSTTLYHYLDAMGLSTAAFPNPLAEVTTSTVVDLKGERHYAESLDDLPAEYRAVSQAWAATLAEYADADALTDAIRRRDTARIKEIWNPLVASLDDTTFYGFLVDSQHFSSFTRRELFGQVGFGTGGWDTDFPNSILEILRVVCTAADDHHRSIVGGSQQLPERLWSQPVAGVTHWPTGTSVQDLNDGATRPRVRGLSRAGVAGQHRYTVTDDTGAAQDYPVVVYTPQVWMLLNTIDSDDDLLPIDTWTAIERTHYMGSTKVFVQVDRPFWHDRDPETGRESMSMTLTDRMSRGTYLLDHGLDNPAVICLSYTWADDSLKLLALDGAARRDLMLKSLRQIYPGVDIESHIIGDPITLSWETERDFMGAFKANLPGHYRYQERLFAHFVQRDLDARHRGFFLAGDDVSWTAGWAEGAVQTALNAVWGVIDHLGGATSPENPGPGDVWDQLAPVRLGDS